MFEKYPFRTRISPISSRLTRKASWALPSNRNKKFVYEEDKKNIFRMSVWIKNSYTLNSSQSSPETDHVLSLVTFSISLTKEVIELLDFELKPLTRRSILGSDCIDSFFML